MQRHTRSSRAAGLAAVLAAALVLLGCGRASPAPAPSASAPTQRSAASPSRSPSPSPTMTAAAATPTAVRGIVPDESATPILLPSVLLLSAPARDVVWGLLAGQRLFRSNDRGSTWEARGLPPGIVNADISFIDDREGWLSSAGSPATQCQQQSLAFWHTGDGGTTWAPLTASGIAAAQCKGGLAFADRMRGFVVASDPNHAPLVYRTGDGGVTWAASAPLPDPAGFASQPGGRTLQPGTVRAFGSTLLLPVRAGNAQHVYRSTDGGANWSDIATVPPEEGALALVSATRWLLIAPGGGSRESTDGGATWHAYATDYGQASPVTPLIVFGDGDVGYATTRGAIQRTTDGGAHWTRLVTPGTQ